MRIYDFAIGWPVAIEEDDFFVNILKAECEARKLSFLFIDEEALDGLTQAIKRGKLKIKVYLDMASETSDPKDEFTRFAYCLKDSGTKVVADPDDVKEAADKSITHFDLLSAKIPVPYTIVIRNWEPTRRLTEEERKGLGFPFVIKPALGYGQKGVKIIRDRRTLKEIALARKFNIGDNFLLQQFIQPIEIKGTPAWFRVYHLFGEIFPCWWSPHTHINCQVTLKEMYDYRLLQLLRISSEIARITSVDWFSCEIAINKKNRRFVAVDYMNDQCAVYPKSRHKDGMPDDLIANIAERMIEKVWQYIHERPILNFRAVWFPKIKIRDEDT